MSMMVKGYWAGFNNQGTSFTDLSPLIIDKTYKCVVVFSSLRIGGLAQWESACLTSRMSWVQIPYPP